MLMLVRTIPNGSWKRVVSWPPAFNAFVIPRPHLGPPHNSNSAVPDRALDRQSGKRTRYDHEKLEGILGFYRTMTYILE
jgi:hypothetical protein